MSDFRIDNVIKHPNFTGEIRKITLDKDEECEEDKKTLTNLINNMDEDHYERPLPSLEGFDFAINKQDDPIKTVSKYNNEVKIIKRKGNSLTIHTINLSEQLQDLSEKLSEKMKQIPLMKKSDSPKKQDK